MQCENMNIISISSDAEQTRTDSLALISAGRAEVKATHSLSDTGIVIETDMGTTLSVG